MTVIRVFASAVFRGHQKTLDRMPDIIENHNGFYIIDINSVSNASEDNIEMFDFDLIKETAAHAVKRYMEMTQA